MSTWSKSLYLSLYYCLPSPPRHHKLLARLCLSHDLPSLMLASSSFSSLVGCIYCVVRKMPLWLHLSLPTSHYRTAVDTVQNSCSSHSHTHTRGYSSCFSKRFHSLNFINFWFFFFHTIPPPLSFLYMCSISHLLASSSSNRDATYLHIFVQNCS